MLTDIQRIIGAAPGDDEFLVNPERPEGKSFFSSSCTLLHPPCPPSKEGEEDWLVRVRVRVDFCAHAYILSGVHCTCIRLPVWN